MDSINNFFLSRFKELNRILRIDPRPTHREEVTGVGAAIYTIAMPSGLAFGSAMVVLFLGGGCAHELFLLSIPTLIIN